MGITLDIGQFESMMDRLSWGKNLTAHQGIDSFSPQAKNLTAGGLGRCCMNRFLINCGMAPEIDGLQPNPSLLV